MKTFLTLVLASICSESLFSQDIAYSRRLFNISTFLNQLDRRVDPVVDGRRKGNVVIVFRTSERGAVLDATAIEGPKELKQAAVEAVRKWKFKPTTISGQPVEMISAVVFDFSTKPITIRTPAPMTAQQLSPSLSGKCLNALWHRDPAAVEVCQSQLQSIERSHSSAIDRITAEDEVGLALLRAGGRADEALGHFSVAIDLAPQCLTVSDAESAYLYWHRATAERELGMGADARQDFLKAEEQINTAAKVIGNESAAGYYGGLAVTISRQRDALPHG